MDISQTFIVLFALLTFNFWQLAVAGYRELPLMLNFDGNRVTLVTDRELKRMTSSELR